MREIVNGVLYDTATSKNLGEWKSSENSVWQDNCVLTLYQKANGEFFLACFGEGVEHYVYHFFDDPVGRIKSILPLSPEDTSAWAEDYLSAEEYIAAFGEVPEDNGYMPTYLLLPSEVVVKAQKTAAALGIEFSEYIEELILADNRST